MSKVQPFIVGKRHQLVHRGISLLRQENHIKTLEGLRRHLQTAVELELSTIPPYLCALYSLKDGSNQESAQVIRSVVMEEMLHMVLAANVLNAIGGQPKVLVPSYPTYLPHSNNAFLVNLEKFCPASIDTFLQIELPAKKDAPPEANKYDTIGQFYEAIELALKEFSLTTNIFTGDPAHQITADYYYGGGGQIIAIDNSNPQKALESALEAINEIVGQGEGIDQSIFDGDHQIFGEQIEFAHYFRFNEIKEGKYYTYCDTPNSGPTGKELKVDWTQVYNMQINPKTANYPKDSEIWKKSYAFNQAYSNLIDNIRDAFNGKPRLLLKSVAEMYNLKYQAIELMNIPINEAGETAGPSFEYLTK